VLAHVWHPGIAFLRDAHIAGSSAPLPIPHEGDCTYMRTRHGRALAADPSYNSNLAPPPRLFEIPMAADAAVPAPLQLPEARR
jgi:hypothetical protein